MFFPLSQRPMCAFLSSPILIQTFVFLLASYSGRSYYSSPEYECTSGRAVFWFEERVRSRSSIRQRRINYNICCQGGKIRIPSFKKPPEFLSELLRFDSDHRSKAFLHKIRQYNCLFAFTSMGASIDRSYSLGHGPPIFGINGQIHHRIGSLLPDSNVPPKLSNFTSMTPTTRSLTEYTLWTSVMLRRVILTLK